jgi:hypothetical protein
VAAGALSSGFGTESVIRGYFREHVDAIGAAIAWG